MADGVGRTYFEKVCASTINKEVDQRSLTDCDN